jgi:hypothetical protein
LATIQLALNNFSTVVHRVGRSPADTISKNNLRLVVTNLVRSLSYYVAKACNGSQPIGIPAQPQGLSVNHGPQLSQLVARINPTFGAVIYNYRLLANTPGAVPVVVQDTAATHTFAGLIAGVKYTIDVNASGSAGTSDWSGAISLTAD